MRLTGVCVHVVRPSDCSTDPRHLSTLPVCTSEMTGKLLIFLRAPSPVPYAGTRPAPLPMTRPVCAQVLQRLSAASPYRFGCLFGPRQPSLIGQALRGQQPLEHLLWHRRDANQGCRRRHWHWIWGAVLLSRGCSCYSSVRWWAGVGGWAGCCYSKPVVIGGRQTSPGAMRRAARRR